MVHVHIDKYFSVIIFRGQKSSLVVKFHGIISWKIIKGDVEGHIAREDQGQNIIHR